MQPAAAGHFTLPGGFYEKNVNFLFILHFSHRPGGAYEGIYIVPLYHRRINRAPPVRTFSACTVPFCWAST